MNDDIRKQEASAIVGKVLKLLESERLTVADSRRILAIADDVLRGISIPLFVPDDLRWCGLLPLPKLDRSLAKNVHETSSLQHIQPGEPIQAAMLNELVDRVKQLERNANVHALQVFPSHAGDYRREM